MRIRTLTVIALTGLGLSGCSLWSKSDKADIATQSDASLRSTPQQDYQFDGQAYDVEIYDTSSQYTASQYTGYDIEIYDPSQFYYYGYNDKGLRPLIVAETTDPRDAAFVKLNGPSQSVDWQNCESRHRGYIFMSDSEMRLDPEFEVCMRNKGYVLSTEYGPSSKTALSARTAGLRGRFSDTGTGSAFFR
ncbi:MAG: hypothetical protein ABJO36_11010 [Litorimonas sp.]